MHYTSLLAFQKLHVFSQADKLGLCKVGLTAAATIASEKSGLALSKLRHTCTDALLHLLPISNPT